MPSPKAPNLVWIDLEMTGLDPNRDQILEIAVIVTNGELEVLAEGPNLALFQTEPVLAAMDDWNQEHHSASGLLGRVRNSQIDAQAAEKMTLDFLENWTSPGLSPICGNSIGHDRNFIRRHMPLLDEFLHYRSIDVSTIKELMRRWRPDLASGFSKKGAHLALDDIRESIAELDFYRQNFFKLTPPAKP